MKLALYATIFSFLFLIIKIPPPFGWNNYIINNSAKLTVLILTCLLTVFFFIWLDKVILFNGKSKALLKYIISEHHVIKPNSEARLYHLKAINEITFYSIEKQDEHLQKTLLEFYHRVFQEIRDSHDSSKPLVYPVDLYFLVNRLNSELTSSQNKKLRAIEHRAVSGVWLLGEFEEIKISNETYRWLWNNLTLICEHERLIKMFWANSSQYFDYRLERIDPNYSYDELKVVVLNQSEIDERENERRDFIETHYALGGLLLYKSQFNTIKYFFEYTQSQPPRYALLPSSMTSIFTWFEHFRNEFKFGGRATFENRYYFPELDNLGSSGQVNYWICRYITVLFIRQYSLNRYYVYEQFTALPDLPQGVSELNNWLESVSYFDICLKDTLADNKLIQDLNYVKIVEDKREAFDEFIINLKSSISERIIEVKHSAELSPEKIKSFEEATKKIITKAFDEYKEIFTVYSGETDASDIKLSFKGSTTLMSKSSFTENDIPSVNYDTFFGEHVCSEIIMRNMPNSFYVARTRRYLLNQDNIVLGLERIITQLEDVVIVAMSIDFEINDILNRSRFARHVIKVSSNDRNTRGALFVLRKRDLPSIEYKDISDDEINKQQLSLLDSNFKLYSSIIDINKPENQTNKDEWKFEGKNDDLDLKVQLTITFNATILWNKQRQVIQINIVSKFKEQGIQNDINEIEQLM